MILLMLGLSPIFIISIYLGHAEEGLGAWACAGILTIGVRTHWYLRGYAWFWPIIGFITLIQVPFVILVPWSNVHFSYIGLLPAAVLDYAIIYGSFKLAEHVAKAMK